MKKHFKKRLAAFKVGLVLSIMITPFCFWKIAEPVHALSNVITYNNYGSFERINQTITVGGVVGFSAAAVRGNLNGTYDGTVRIYITISGGHTISDFSVIPTNCFIQYYSSSYIDIAFNGVSQWEVAFIGTTYNAHSYITIDSLTNWNMLYIYQSTDNMIKTTMGYLDDLEGYVGRCNASIIRCENLLTTIANNGGTGGSSSTINNIDVNVDLIADDLNLLKTSSDGILGALVDFLTDGLGQIITMESVLSAIDDTVNQLVVVNTSLTNIGTTLTNISNTLTSINSAVQNIDSSIDTISWVNGTISQSGISRTYGSGYSLDSLSINSNNNKIYYRANIGIINRPNRIICVHIPFYPYNASLNMNTTVSIYNDSINEILYMDYAYQYGMDVYIKVNTTNTVSTLNLVFEFSADSFNNNASFAYQSGSNVTMKYIENTDIEYWTLMEYFDQYNYNRLILKAIQDLNLSVTQTTVQDTINNVNNYNSTMNQVHNVENNYTNQFNTFNPIVQTELNTKLTIPNGFIEGTNFIKRLFPRVIDNSSLVGFPFMLILAAVILFVILG